jgi:putative transcriptional regulator
MRQSARKSAQPLGSAPHEAIRPEEVRTIRYRLKQSQVDFAAMIGVSVATLQSWEDGRHHPDGPAKALLRVAAKSPRMVAKALGRA